MRKDPSLEEGLALITVLALIGGGYKLYQQFNTDRMTFYVELAGFIVIVALVIGIIIWLRRRADLKKDAFIAKIQKDGLEQEIYNFINRFGLEKNRKGNWGFRDHNFKWDRLEDFRKNIQDHGITVSSRKWEDTHFILRHFIQIQEEKLTRGSIGKVPKLFSTLNGKDFEDLLYRLFIADGYSVQRTGKSGDQGADLIANKGNERIVVQAKRYQASVSNSAIQEAVAAQKMYDCNKATVITTSEFTAGARTLAKANGVELIEKKRLQQLLLQFLNESWA